MNIWNRLTNVNHPYASNGRNGIARTMRRLVLMILLGTLTLMLVVPITVPTSVLAATLPPLGTAGSFGVLAGSAVTNTGATTVAGDLGVSPGSAVSGFPPGIVMGTIHAGDAVAAQAQNDATTAYNDAAGQACDSNLTGQNLGGMTLIPGVYCFNSSAQLTGQLTLNGQGNSNSVFIFQIGSTLTTASNATVQVINSARPCNIFWQVGSSAVLGTSTHFEGNILALTSITLNTSATTNTGLYALNGAVTLDTNTIQACSFVQGPTSTPTAVSTTTATLASTTTPVTTATTVPSTATSRPGATNTSIPGATNTRVPVATNTSIAGATNTRVPVATDTSLPEATNTSIPGATDVPTQTPGTINTLTPIGTSTLIPGNTPIPTDTFVPGDTATAIALATESVVPSTTAIATGTAISAATSTSIAVTPTTAIAIGTATAAVTVTGTQTPTPLLPRTGAGDRWAGPFTLLLGVLLLLIGLGVRMLFRKMGKKVGR